MLNDRAKLKYYDTAVLYDQALLMEAVFQENNKKGKNMQQTEILPLAMLKF